MEELKGKAESLLKTAVSNSHARFRSGQWESIEALLQNQRVLVVQRTGWGKSIVYFLATKLLRQQGRGPTLLISPLLSLMRNQISAAERLNLRAATINSTNMEAWQEVQGELLANKVDVLLISPERLANPSFRRDVLANIADNIGLFVVDEAHCISDWGHDFRPDYKLISRVMQLVPANLPILATTATANNRVVEDIRLQLGKKLAVQRGSLSRKSLRLQNIRMPDVTSRMAWLAQTIPLLPGSGIVYTLTQQDAETLSAWLRHCNINAQAYHAGVGDGSSAAREELEEDLLHSRIKVLVATVALGMGFDKPDLGFVIHFQRPASVVHYYQQVGRAGRALDTAYGVLLYGREDDRIVEYFRKTAFPPQTHIAQILDALEQAPNGASLMELTKLLNLSRSQIEKALKFMNSEEKAPVHKDGTRWYPTPNAGGYEIDRQHIAKITSLRMGEQDEMDRYMTHPGCLMQFLQNALDDDESTPCGKCANCRPEYTLGESHAPLLAERADLFLKESPVILPVKKAWPAANVFIQYELVGREISPGLRAEEGRALSSWRGPGWGELVAQCKYERGHFSDELVEACVRLLHRWKPAPAPQWVTCIPSLTRPLLVPDFSQRLAGALNLPFIDCIEKIGQNGEQKNMRNAWHQAQNLDGVFRINETRVPKTPCLLMDDVLTSGWTVAVVAALLAQAGSGPVFPLVLAHNPRNLN